MKIDKFEQGAANWTDLMTTDLDGAVAFYSGLFGWEIEVQELPDGGHYDMARIGGDEVAGLGEQNPQEAAMHIPPHWNIYLTVNDVDEVATRVQAAGGQVLAPPFEVMEFGRMTVIMDPTNAPVSLWQVRSHKGFGRMGEPGFVSWAELITSDPKAAADFFVNLLGVKTSEMSMGEGEPYRMLEAAENQGAGIMKKTEEMGQMPNTWGVYFEVADADATAARASELGGRVLQEPWDIEGVGRMALLADPQGAIFSVIKSAPMQ